MSDAESREAGRGKEGRPAHRSACLATHGKTPRPQTVTYTSEAGLILVGDAWGARDAPPVLPLHGGGQTRHAWGSTARILAERGWYAVALDLRGHGDSAWAPDGNYTKVTHTPLSVIDANAYFRRAGTAALHNHR